VGEGGGREGGRGGGVVVGGSGKWRGEEKEEVNVTSIAGGGVIPSPESAPFGTVWCSLLFSHNNIELL